MLDYSIDYGPRASYELQGEAGSIGVHNAWAMKGEPGRLRIVTLARPSSGAADRWLLPSTRTAGRIRPHRPTG